MMNNTVLILDPTQFTLACYESPYYLLSFMVNGDWESINQDRLPLTFQRDALPHKNLPVSVSESSSFPFLSHALSLALKRVHNPLAIRKAR